MSVHRNNVAPEATATMGTSVIFRKFAVLLWAFLLATAAIAGEEHRTKIEIAVDDDESGHQSFKFDSKDAGFDLHDMTVGETRELTGESGDKALVTRTEDGFVMEVNGEKIDLSNMHDMDDAHVVHMSVDGDHEKMKKHKKVRMIKTEDDNSVTILSGKPIDEETRERIRELLESAGQDGEVVFIDHNELTAAGAHGRHEVRIIKKEVDVTN